MSVFIGWCLVMTNFGLIVCFFQRFVYFSVIAATRWCFGWAKRELGLKQASIISGLWISYRINELSCRGVRRVISSSVESKGNNLTGLWWNRSWLCLRSCMVKMTFMHTLYLHVVLHGGCTVKKVGYTFDQFCFFVHVHNVCFILVLLNLYGAT